MSALDQVAVLSGVWALAWFALAVIMIHCHHWRYAALSFGLAVFFSRYVLRIVAEAHHDIGWLDWATSTNAIIVTMAPCVVLTVGLAAETVIRGKLVQ